jgi:hypothetical protein
MSPDQTFDPTIQSEDIAFRSDELVKCDRCGRQNAPNRLECIYCGAALAVSAEKVDKFTLRKLDAWEPGVNILVTGGNGDLRRASDLLSLDADQLAGILASDVALPVARVDENAVAVLETKLNEAGFETRAVSDLDLNTSKPPVRISGMEMNDEGVTVVDFNTRERTRLTWSDLVLVVKGTFSSGKIDATEKRKLRKTTTSSETTTSSDEGVFDLYTATDVVGYRVQLAGFDYSCLGDKMAPLATENMSRLVEDLRTRSGLKVVDDYRSIRHLLVGIWDIESRTDPKGLHQTGFGKREFCVIHSTNNVEQFTRFSRLQRVML